MHASPKLYMTRDRQLISRLAYSNNAMSETLAIHILKQNYLNYYRSIITEQTRNFHSITMNGCLRRCPAYLERISGYEHTPDFELNSHIRFIDRDAGKMVGSLYCFSNFLLLCSTFRRTRWNWKSSSTSSGGRLITDTGTWSGTFVLGPPVVYTATILTGRWLEFLGESVIWRD